MGTAAKVGLWMSTFFFFQAEDGIRDYKVTGVQTCALPISGPSPGTHPQGAQDRAAPRDHPDRHARAGQPTRADHAGALRDDQAVPPALYEPPLQPPG